MGEWGWTTNTLIWVRFDRLEGGGIWIRQDLIEAYEDNAVWTTRGFTYNNLKGVIETMKKVTR